MPIPSASVGRVREATHSLTDGPNAMPERYSCVFRTSAGNVAHGGLVVDQPSSGVARAVTVLAGIAGALCMAVVLFKLLGPPRPRSVPLPQ